MPPAYPEMNTDEVVVRAEETQRAPVPSKNRAGKGTHEHANRCKGHGRHKCPEMLQKESAVPLSRARCTPELLTGGP